MKKFKAPQLLHQVIYLKNSAQIVRLMHSLLMPLINLRKFLNIQSQIMKTTRTY